MNSANTFSFNDDSQKNLKINLARRKRRCEKRCEKQASFDSEVSLTYSSSSQAGESTDSSCDETENRPKTHRERVKSYHQRNPQRYGGMCREVSNAADSLNYSEDEESLYRQQEFLDTTGQTSDSYAHDGGGQPKLTSIPATLDTRRLSRISSDKSSYKNQPFSPGTMASSDVSLSSLGSNNPSSPPPRYRRVSSDQATEVWYAKWWMCGFTDALNINSNS